MNVIHRQDVVDEARTQLGVRWQHQAAVRGVALDCIGLLKVVALALGIYGGKEWKEIPAFHNYGRQPDPKVLLAGCDLFLLPVARSDVGLGDIHLFRFTAEPQHFGIVSRLDPMYVIHALARARDKGKVTENRVDSVWRSRIVRTYRFRGVG